MRNKNLSGYVSSYYYIIKWWSPCVPLMFLCLSIYFLLHGEQDAGTIFCVLIPLLLAVGLLFIRSKALNNTSTYFVCEDGIITNRSKYGNYEVDLKISFYICQISTPGQAKVSVTELFYMLSNAPLTYIPGWEENQLKAILALSQNGVVIIPSNKETSIWLSEHVGKILIPQYSKVAYIPRIEDE